MFVCLFISICKHACLFLYLKMWACLSAHYCVKIFSPSKICSCCFQNTFFRMGLGLVLRLSAEVGNHLHMVFKESGGVRQEDLLVTCLQRWAHIWAGFSCGVWSQARGVAGNISAKVGTHLTALFRGGVRSQARGVAGDLCAKVGTSDRGDWRVRQEELLVTYLQRWALIWQHCSEGSEESGKVSCWWPVTCVWSVEIYL